MIFVRVAAAAAICAHAVDASPASEIIPEADRAGKLGRRDSPRLTRTESESARNVTVGVTMPLRLLSLPGWLRWRRHGDGGARLLPSHLQLIMMIGLLPARGLVAASGPSKIHACREGIRFDSDTGKNCGSVDGPHTPPLCD